MSKELSEWRGFARKGITSKEPIEFERIAICDARNIRLAKENRSCDKCDHIKEKGSYYYLLSIYGYRRWRAVSTWTEERLCPPCAISRGMVILSIPVRRRWISWISRIAWH